MEYATAQVRLLTSTAYDDRLPSWSHDGKTILFQRNEYGQDEGWKVVYAKIYRDIGSLGTLKTLKAKTGNITDFTDCSWSYDDSHILSSSPPSARSVPNIWSFPLNAALHPVQITNTEYYEDGAASQSHDGTRTAFESHYGDSEEQSSEIWIIAN